MTNNANRRRTFLAALMGFLVACGGGGGDGDTNTQRQDPAVPVAFTNWENPPVHPLALTPDGNLLLVCNLADHRLEIFDLTSGRPVLVGSVAVGLDPTSVRARTNTEAWVTNHVSDSVSVVDLAARRVRFTLQTDDEPADVVFAGDPERAYVSCSQANTILAFSTADPTAPPERIELDVEEPRALAVSPDGNSVYCAVYESGNRTTVLGAGALDIGLGNEIFPPTVDRNGQGPHGGVNPAPNAGAVFDPPLNSQIPAPPRVSILVRQHEDGRWRDDTGADWTDQVSGSDAAMSGRPEGWSLPDRDVAVVDTETSTVSYVSHCMNMVMGIAVRPNSGEVCVVGTDATNEVRYEPVLSGRFLRVLIARHDPGSPEEDPVVLDLNPHLDYTTPRVNQAERDRSIGDPRAICCRADGRAYVAGMGSNNVLVLDAELARVARIEVGEGPCGLALDEGRNRLYVLNRFEGSLSVVDTQTNGEVERVAFFDPTPETIRRGRPHLYDTHRTSGLGHTSCAACHVDARTDRIAWDLGDPSGEVKQNEQVCLTEVVADCQDFHPMKGPMLTQTLVDIIGKEPHHWRGDRDGLEEFNGAFVGLLGDDATLTAQEMQEFEDFLATIRFAPNPFRNFDNTLPTDLPLPGHFTTGRFAPEGQPLPNGDAVEGLRLYRTANLDGGVPGFQCVTCHTLPTGIGPDVQIVGLQVQPVPPGPNGERHHALVSVDGFTNIGIKIPHLRNLYDRVGMTMTGTESRAGFGFVHDGSIDSIERFIAEPIFSVDSDQEVADLTAFMLAFSGSNLPEGSFANLLELPGPASLDTHAAVGKQVTVRGPGEEAARIAAMLALADAGAVDVVARGVQDGANRGWSYDAAAGRFLADRNGETISAAGLRALAALDAPLTYTVVPRGNGRRLGVDRDNDGWRDGTERDEGSNPTDAASTPE